MRFGLFDLLFGIACITSGVVVWPLLPPDSPKLPVLAQLFCGLCVYLALVYPVYRGLRLFPMVLPRCPCCGKFGQGFQINGGPWPRVTFLCPLCNDEFVIWFNGKPDNQETWEKPVLALKWPYAWGIFKRMKKPEAAAAPNGGPAPINNPEAPPHPAV